MGKFVLVYVLSLIAVVGAAIGASYKSAATADPYSWAMAEDREKDFPVELKIPSGEGRITINLKTGIVEYYNTTLDQSGLAFWNYVMDTFPWVKRQIIREYIAAREKAIERTK